MHGGEAMLDQNGALPLFLDDLRDLLAKLGRDDEVAQPYLWLRDLNQTGDVSLGARKCGYRRKG